MIADISTAVKISMRRATTAFDRSNLTIMDVLDLGNEITGTNYSADEFFQFYNQALSIDMNQTTSVQENFLVACWSYLSVAQEENQGPGESGLSILRSLLAVPVLQCNNLALGGPIPDDLGRSISIANINYRVTFSYMFC